MKTHVGISDSLLSYNITISKNSSHKKNKKPEKDFLSF